MKLITNDVIKFYDFLIHYNTTSRNIGIVGTKDKFDNYMKVILKDYKDTNALIFINDSNTKYTIIKDDIEYTYYYIQDSTDMQGKSFRKFI